MQERWQVRGESFRYGFVARQFPCLSVCSLCLFLCSSGDIEDVCSFIELAVVSSRVPCSGLGAFMILLFLVVLMGMFLS